MSLPALTHGRAPARGARARPASGAIDVVLERYLLLPIGVILALVWANSRPESYFTFAHATSFAVNNVGMALFIALAAQEVREATMAGAPLHSWRRWGLPLIAAAGGVAGSVLAYHAYIAARHQPVFAEGWPLAIAIDLAWVYFVARSIFHKHPAVPFVVLVAVATDALGLAVIGLRRPAFELHGTSVLLMAAALALAWWLRRRSVAAFWPYLFLAGGLSWAALYLAGIHPALALVPIVPFLRHAPRSIARLADTPDAPPTSPRHFEHVWGNWVQVILFFFGLVNAGVILQHYGTGTWGLVVAALVGRPLGLLAGTGLAVALGFSLPARLHARDLVVVALAASISFTFALFFATSVYTAGPLLSEARIGALITGVGVVLAFGAARLLRVGRFRHAWSLRVYH